MRWLEIPKTLRCPTSIPFFFLALLTQTERSPSAASVIHPFSSDGPGGHIPDMPSSVMPVHDVQVIQQDLESEFDADEDADMMFFDDAIPNEYNCEAKEGAGSEESVLDYARSHGLTSEYEQVNPFANVSRPSTATSDGSALGDLINAWEDAYQKAFPSRATPDNLTDETWTADLNGIRYLKNVCDPTVYDTDKACDDLAETARKSAQTFKLDQPLLATDPELDTLEMKARFTKSDRSVAPNGLIAESSWDAKHGDDPTLEWPYSNSALLAEKGLSADTENLEFSPSDAQRVKEFFESLPKLGGGRLEDGSFETPRHQVRASDIWDSWP